MERIVSAYVYAGVVMVVFAFVTVFPPPPESAIGIHKLVIAFLLLVIGLNNLLTSVSILKTVIALLLIGMAFFLIYSPFVHRQF